MNRIGLLVCIGTLALGASVCAATSVEVQPTGKRRALLPGLGLRATFEDRLWDFELKNVSPPHRGIEASLSSMDFEAEITAFGAELLFDVGSRVELRGILAAYDVEIEGNAGRRRFDVESDIGLVYGIGATLRLPALWLPGWNLELDVELLRGSFDDVELYYSRERSALASASDTELQWHELSISPTISRRLSIFTPYAGLRFTAADADVTTHVSDTEEELSFETEDLLGLVVGTRVDIGSFVHADIHVDLLGNRSLAIAVVIRF